MKSERPGQSESGGRLSLERRSELLTEALSLLHVPDDTKEEARAWIADVAAAFLRDLDTEQHGPRRLADLARRTEDVASRMRGLADDLDEILPLLRHGAYAYGALEDWTEDWSLRLHQRLDKEPPRLLSLLEKVAGTLDKVRSRLPQDRGGERPLPALFVGLPKQRLAAECWELFYLFRPGEATATVPGREDRPGGDFYNFTAAVYELATGEEAEGPGVGLSRYVKRAASYLNRRVKRNPALGGLFRGLAPGQSPVGMLSSPAHSPGLYQIEQRLTDDLMAARAGKRRGRTKGRG